MAGKKKGLMDLFFQSDRSSPSIVGLSIIKSGSSNTSGGSSNTTCADIRQNNNNTSSLESTRNRGLNSINPSEFQENKGVNPTSGYTLRTDQEPVNDIGSSSPVLKDDCSPQQPSSETACENSPSGNYLSTLLRARSTPSPVKDRVTERSSGCLHSLVQGVQPALLMASPSAVASTANSSAVSSTRRRSSVGKGLTSRRKSVNANPIGLSGGMNIGLSGSKVDTTKPLEFPATPETIYEYHRQKPFLSRNEEWLIMSLNEYECLVGSVDIIKAIAKHSQFFEVEPDELWSEFFEFVEGVATTYDDVINDNVWQEFRDERYAC